MKIHSNRSIASGDFVIWISIFISGFQCLVYEICLIRISALHFGTTNSVLIIIVSTVFLGFAAGNYLFGLFTKKTEYPLIIYGYAEILLGFFGITHSYFYFLISKPYSYLYSFTISTPFYNLLLKCVGISILILPPAILLGGAFPVLCHYLIKKEGKIIPTISIFFGLNTIGGAIGCTICAFLLLPALGIKKTIMFSGSISILIGFLILFFHRSKFFIKIEIKKKNQELKKQIKAFILKPKRFVKYLIPEAITIYLLVFLFGFTLFCTEIVWIRFLFLLFHRSELTLTILAGVFLTGMVLGSIIVAIFEQRIKNHALIFGIIHLLIGIYVLYMLSLPVNIWKNIVYNPDISNQIIVNIILTLIPAILYGILIPVVIGTTISHQSGSAFKTGYKIGQMIAIYKSGGIAGIILTGLIMLPWLGIHSTLLIITSVCIVSGLTIVVLLERNITLNKKIFITVLGIISWGSILLSTQIRLPIDYINLNGQLVDFIEGRESTLIIQKSNDNLSLGTDNQHQNEIARGSQILAAHIPMILHNNPKEILIVGLGSYQTAGKYLYYDINRLDCVTREKKIVPLIERYFDSNWLKDPRINIITDDERNFIANIKNQYDIISLGIENVDHHYYGFFNSIDFYEQCKQKLYKNGFVVQHIPVLHTSTNEFKSIAKCFISVFPKSILWYNGLDLLLIGSLSTQPTIFQNRIDLIDNDIHINIDFNYTYWGGPRHWLTHDDMFLAGFLLSSDKLSNFVNNSPLIYDDVPSLKYNYIRNMENHLYLEFIKENLEPTENIYKGTLNDLTRDYIKYIRILNINDIYARQLVKEYERTLEIKYLKEAYYNNPKNYKVNYLLGVDWNNYGNLELAIKYFSQSIAINPNVAKVHNVLAMLYHQIGNFTKALYHYYEALRINPSYYQVHNNIGVLLENQGSHKEAIDHFEQALQIKPDFKNSQINLRRIKEKYPFLSMYSEK